MLYHISKSSCAHKKKEEKKKTLMHDEFKANSNGQNGTHARFRKKLNAPERTREIERDMPCHPNRGYSNNQGEDENLEKKHDIRFFILCFFFFLFFGWRNSMLFADEGFAGNSNTQKSMVVVFAIRILFTTSSVLLHHSTYRLNMTHLIKTLAILMRLRTFPSYI